MPKKDGKDRMVVDMRKVNEHILEEDFAPAIPITHLMAEIQSAGSQLFSSIDIQHAFFSSYKEGDGRCSRVLCGYRNKPFLLGRKFVREMGV